MTYHEQIGVCGSESRGPYIWTYTGRRFFIEDIWPEDVSIRDIAHHLANQCRYAGACPRPYFVAQHSVHVSELVPREDALWGLMHDMSEFILPDVPRPFKYLVPGYVTLENLTLKKMGSHFGLPWPMPDSVHHIDQNIVRAECKGIWRRPWWGTGFWPAPPDWAQGFDELPIKIKPWSRRKAERRFLERFEELINGA